jgi:ubiquinone/menaquinone biosynthesis C-methylase UbiE
MINERRKLKILMDFSEAKVILGDEFSRDADFLSSVVSKLKLVKNSNILDVGTGRGQMAILLALHGYQVLTGEPEGANWGDWKTPAKKVNVEDMITFKPFNAEKMPFEDASFDAIFLYATFHHIGNKKLALNELLRVMKPKGKLIITELTDEGVEVVRKRWRGHPDAVDPRTHTKDFVFDVKVIEGNYLNAYIYSKVMNE